MLAKLHTFSLLGIEAVPVEVSRCLAGRDSQDDSRGTARGGGQGEHAPRRTGDRQFGFQRPYDRVVINLAPAELPKQAATFDLPITLGVLAGSGQLDVRSL